MRSAEWGLFITSLTKKKPDLSNRKTHCVLSVRSRIGACKHTQVTLHVGALGCVLFHFGHLVVTTVVVLVRPGSVVHSPILRARELFRLFFKCVRFGYGLLGSELSTCMLSPKAMRKFRGLVVKRKKTCGCTRSNGACVLCRSAKSNERQGSTMSKALHLCPHKEGHRSTDGPADREKD